MKIEIDENKILTEILERDGDLHERIKAKIRDRLVETLVERIENKYLRSTWRGEKSIADDVLADLEEKQTKLVKDILKTFYDSYRYKKANLEILKKLQAFLNEV